MNDSQSLRPRSLDDLTRTIAWAVAEEQPLDIVCSGSKRAFGRPVDARYQLDLRDLRGVDMYEPGELVLSAGAGTPLHEIQTMLRERNQELAFEPPDYGLVLGGEAGRQSIGGVMACNLAGPRRIKAGAARDHLLGVHCVTGYGSAIKTGGRVVKNVTGYDLCKLLAGSFGTLAVMSHVTFKVLPAAEMAPSLLVRSDDEDALLSVLRQSLNSPFDVSGAAMLPASTARETADPAVTSAVSAVACIRLVGTERSVDDRLSRLKSALKRPGIELDEIGDEHSRALWALIRDVVPLRDHDCLWRLSMSPAGAAAQRQRLVELSDRQLFDWSGGLVWLATNETSRERADELRRVVAAAGGGHATLVRASLETRQAVAPFHPQAASLAALTARVKKSFDPNAILNPGRLYEGV